MATGNDGQSEMTDSATSTSENTDAMTEQDERDFEEFHKSLGLVSTFTKQMVQLAITQLRPEFERMAGRAAEKAVDSKMMKAKDMQDELNTKEKELNQLRLEKKQLQSRLEKEKQHTARSQQAVGNMEQKERDIRKLESDISALKFKLRKKSEELKRERDKATTEENKRLELESALQSEVDKLRRDLDRLKGALGQVRSAKNVGDEEMKRLRERERQLLDEIDELKTQQSPRRRKTTR